MKTATEIYKEAAKVCKETLVLTVTTNEDVKEVAQAMMYYEATRHDRGHRGAE